MAQKPVKRRSASGDEDEEEHEVDSRTAALKRVKLEHAPEAAREPTPELEDDAVSVDSQGFEEEDVTDFEDDGENLLAYQAARKNDQRNQLSSEAGVLKSITLVNFMCHSHLSLNFFKRMNFLVGHNGSGKSAILTAVAVALGSKAATTGRGAGLKDLIKRDCDSAKIILTLANKGIEAYRPDVYNPDIVIERHIDKNGMSSWKFRATRDGRIISNKRDELTQICAKFQINVDSPLTVLTQDTAKTFLMSTDEKQLYEFFLRGTSLADLTTQYRQSEASLELINRSLTRARESKPDLQLEVGRRGRQLEEARAAGGMITRRDQLDHELAWAYVQLKEKQVHGAQALIEEFKEKQLRSQEQLKENEAKQRPVEAEMNQLNEGITAFDAVKGPLEQERRRLLSKRKEADREMQDSKDALEDCQAMIETMKTDMGDVVAKLNESGVNQERDRLIEEKRTAHDRHQDMLSKLQRRDLPTRSRAYEDAKTAIQHAVDEQGRLRGELSNSEERQRLAQTRLRNLEGQEKNQINAYGLHVDQVLREIQKAKWRHSVPIGPLGVHVQLNDPRYKNTMQSLLGNLMCGFAVRDKHDKDQLMKILTNCQRQGYRPGTGSNGLPPVIQHSGELFDFSNGDLSNMGETVLSKLTINNEHVLRILINTAKIEKNFVALDQRAAEAEIKRLLGPGLKQVLVYSEGPDRPFQQTGYAGTGRTRESGPQQQWRGNALFYTNIAAEIHQQREAVAQAEDERKNAEQALRVQDAKLRQSRSDLQQARDSVEKVQRGIQDFQTKLQRLSDEITDLRPEDSNALEQSRNEIQAEITRLQDEREKLNTDMEEKRAKIAEIQESIARVDAQLNEYGPEKERRVRAAQALFQQLMELQQTEKHWEKSIQRYRAEVEARQVALDELSRELKDYISKAHNISEERVQSTRKPEVINRERAAVAKAIEDAGRRGRVDIHEATRRYNTAKGKLDEVHKFIVDWQKLAHVIDDSLLKRKELWLLLRKHISVRARTAFITNIARRSMEGQLVFDHKSETLSIRVHSTGLQQTQAESSTQHLPQYKTPANMSGGERSFTTVSLLLSLWDTSTSMIRCLDEWDVFLDSVNRQVAAKMLIQGAQEDYGKQFLLITPQDMAGVNSFGADGGVIKLSDPERNQSTLNF